MIRNNAFLRRWLIAGVTGLLTAIIGIGVSLSPLGTELEKGVGLSWLFSIRGPVKAPPEVVVVGINEGTGRRMGLPNLPRDWPRSVHGQLVRKLTEAGASGIAFDMAFTLPKSRANFTGADTAGANFEGALLEGVEGLQLQ